MDTRFAGSERLAERRRRRLAVEADEIALREGAVEPLELASAGNTRRFAHGGSAETRPVAQTAISPLPVERLIPTAWWKYLAVGIGLGALAAGTVAAGWYAPQWSEAAGVSFARVLSTGESRATDWLASMFLLLAAQLALINWWGRSRSLKDFDGRYRLWMWTAAACLVTSFCAATGGHRLLGDLAEGYVPAHFRRKEALCWLVPVALIAMRLFLSLRREMLACGPSRWLLYVSAAGYVGAASLELDALPQVAGRVREITFQAMCLAGHLGLLMSMWLHARHVWHRTADPSAAPSRRSWIPRPHLKLPRLALTRKPSHNPDPDEGQAVERRRATKRRTSQASDTQPEESDARPDEPAPTPRAGDAARPAAVAAPPEPARVDRSAFDERDSSDVEPVSEPEPLGDEPTFEKPDLRGLSKKQRRRMMQELRDRERAARQS
ncbi:MAG: hypothetical protein ACT4QC_04870 [Planctomycetaceae bacterium]